MKQHELLKLEKDGTLIVRVPDEKERECDSLHKAILYLRRK